MSKIPATVVILSFNSEATITNAINSVLMFEHILVVDCGSTDSTLSILHDLPVKVISHDWEGYSQQRSFSLKHCRYEWVFQLDSDEVAEPELIENIAKCINEDQAVGIRVRIRECFMGVLNVDMTKHCSKIRIFKRACARYQAVKAHEGVVVSGKILSAQGMIVHYGEHNIATKISKINTYSTLKADEKFIHGHQAGLICLLTVFPLTFFKSYILRRQFLNGIRGLIAAMCNAFYAFLKQAKLYEIKHKGGIQ